MTLDVPEWAADLAHALPYPAVFTTVSGAHLYGFASVDSDLDLRGVHLLLLALKRHGEHDTCPSSLRAAVDQDIPHLRTELENARETSHLPDKPGPAAVDALHQLVVRTRLAADSSSLPGGTVEGGTV